MKTALEFLRQQTKVAFDSSEFLEVQRYNPDAVTTNPSLILKALNKTDYLKFFQDLLKHYKHKPLHDVLNQVLVHFGKEFVKRVNGDVSIELNGDLAFKTGPSIEQMNQILSLCKDHHIQDQVLIKIPATWEGVQVAKVANQLKVRCNMTLVFSVVQALLCSRVKAFIVSPFVGRVYDLCESMRSLIKQSTVKIDPGLQLLDDIRTVYEEEHNRPYVMAASFRTVDQVLAAAGCDYVTINQSLFDSMNLKTNYYIPRSKIFKSYHHGYVRSSFITERENFYSTLKQNKSTFKLLMLGLLRFRDDTQQLRELISKHI
jgi:transaldolase